MFVFRKSVLAVRTYTRSSYKNFSWIDKYRFSDLQFITTKHLTKSYSSNTTNIDNEQNTTATVNVSEQKTEDPHLPDYDAITQGNKELEHKLKVIMLETEVLRQEGHLIPPNKYIKPDMWKILLNSQSRSQRQKYLVYLFKNAKKKENHLLKKIEKQKSYQEFKAQQPLEGQNRKDIPIEELASQYGLSYNNIFLRFHDTTMNRFYNNRLIQALQYGEKIVIDCGFDQDMTRRENYNCAKQLMLLFAENRNNDQPFDIHFTSVNKDSDMIKMLNKYIPTMYELEFPMNTHNKSYLDLFPKEKLVYLTPHCREEMETYDPDAVYIIGALVDKINNEPLSLAKAKREGLNMKTFPLDKYLQWGPGSGKSLTLNQCVSVLLDLKETGDWKHALRHVPKRKLMHHRRENFDNSKDNKSIYFNKERNWKYENRNENFGRTRDENRFNSNKDRWEPKYYKKPSYIKNE